MQNENFAGFSAVPRTTLIRLIVGEGHFILSFVSVSRLVFDFWSFGLFNTYIHKTGYVLRSCLDAWPAIHNQFAIKILITKDGFQNRNQNKLAYFIYIDSFAILCNKLAYLGFIFHRKST